MAPNQPRKPLRECLRLDDGQRMTEEKLRELARQDSECGRDARKALAILKAQGGGEAHGEP